MRPLAVRQVHDRRDTVGAALGDDIRRPPLDTQVGALGVTTHQDDPLGAEATGGEHRGETDGSIAHHGHRLAGLHPGHESGVVPGQIHVGQGQQ